MTIPVDKATYTSDPNQKQCDQSDDSSKNIATIPVIQATKPSSDNSSKATQSATKRISDKKRQFQWKYNDKSNKNT